MKRERKKLTGSHKKICAAVAAALALSALAGGVEASAASLDLQPELPVESTDSILEEAPAENELTDEELRAYFGESVFIGDSIMLGFRNYSAKQKTYVHDIQFLAVGSYGVRNALKPVTKDNVHPKYKGKKYQLWEAIPLMECKRAFILFGMNDIAPLGLEGARDKYKELIDKILEASPDLEIHIISMTYTLEGEGKKKLNNTNIAEYNTLLQEMAEENGWGYIDLCTPTSDGSGNLAEECCSDGFVHLTKAAYTIWEAELINYANTALSAEETGTPEDETGTEIIAE